VGLVASGIETHHLGAGESGDIATDDRPELICKAEGHDHRPVRTGGSPTTRNSSMVARG
jgi:hypothetical protein